MSSTAAFKPMAGLVLYGATKAFVKELSLGLRLERSYFMDAADCVEKALAGFRQGRATVVVDPVDRAVVRLPRPVIRRLDGWALRQLTGS